MTEREKREKAWVGDAVLGLYAREWILKQPAIDAPERAAVYTDMTSNHFLSALGQPTAMEAEIGLVYEKEGLERAFAFIEEKFMPVFLKQRRNRSRQGSWRDRRR